jgi:hypothetical protein
MPELSDEEFMIIKEFIDAIELDPNTPEELVNKYTNALQVVNAFGKEESADQGIAAPA